MDKKFVIKGLPLLEIDDITTDIKELGITPKKLVKMKTKEENFDVNTATYYLAVPYDTDVEQLYAIKTICGVCVKWEKYKNPKRITQCYNCQSFGHGTTNCHQNPKCVKCHWNANGLEHKDYELKNFILSYDLDIMLVNETKTPDRYNFKLNGFSSLKKDRPGKQSGGGLLIIINNRIKYSEIDIDFDNTTIESLGININNDVTLYTTYVRPEITNNTNKIDTNELDKLIKNTNKAILIGDFNAKHTTWKCKTNNTNGKILFNYANKNNLTILAPDRYTLYPANSNQPNIVDFAILKNLNASIETVDELDSDHMPIIMTLGELINL
ncbi:GSCOCG00006611001-RA-CDS [Cotesia congregata]|nr:GSCOCG00006611001-RA-CDS [Cotesia congregata]